MGYNLIRFPVALVLIAAAGLKIQQMFSLEVSDHRGWHILLVQAELALAVWLLSGVWRRASWMVVTAAFAGFATVSLYQGLRGAESCGCFGAVQINPWLTFVLDTAVVVLLLLWPPVRGDEYRPRTQWVVTAVAGAVLLVVALPGSWMMWRYTPGLLLRDGTIAGDARHVGLFPQYWAGAPLPLLPYIDIETDLSSGRWSIMFYSHRCPQCHYAIRELVEQSAGHPDQEAIGRIVLVSVPPHGTIPEEEAMRRMFQVGRLRDDRSWYLKIPTVIRLEDGIVLAVMEDAYLSAPPRGEMER